MKILGSCVDILERASGKSPRSSPRVSDWCMLHASASCEVISEIESITRDLPSTIEADISDVFRSRQNYEIPAKYLAQIPGVQLIGKNGLVILPDGTYAEETMHSMDRLARDPDFRAFRFHRRKRQHAGRFFSTLMLWGQNGNYYHWVHDALLRMYGILERLPADVRLIVPGKLRPFQEDALTLMGIDRSRWVPFTGEELWALEWLFFAPPTSKTGHSSPHAVAWFRHRVNQELGLGVAAAKRRVFVSRRLADRRRIVNESDVVACLQQYGFETFTTEALSFRDQAALFADAEVVVANHGAGLTNVMFMPPGAKVIEIFEPGLIHYCYWTLSEAAGLEYWYFVGDAVPTSRYPTQADVFVPLDKLERTLQAALA